MWSMPRWLPRRWREVCRYSIFHHYTLLYIDYHTYILGLSKTDVDECNSTDISSTCGQMSICINTPGSFMCSCLEGYELSGSVGCTGKFVLHFKMCIINITVLLFQIQMSVCRE